MNGSRIFFPESENWGYEMYDKTQNRGGLKTRIHYESIAAQLDLSELWQRYIADLAYELFGPDGGTGEAFIRNVHITVKEPLDVLKEAAKEAKPVPQLDENHPFTLLSTNMDVLAERIWTAQMRTGLPLIEAERQRYIRLHYGRLLSVLGAEYWDKETGEYKQLWDYRLNAPVKDPYTIDIITLQRLGHMKKRLEMLGTVSLTPFFSVLTEDMNRFDFIAKIWEKLMHFQLCTVQEINKLFGAV
jgi:hypothetical protein